jgi:hypothetical protein
MFPRNSVSSYQRPGLANVCIDPVTVSDDYLLLIADWYPEQILANQRDSSACHEAITHLVVWSDNDRPPTQHNVTDHIQMRLLSLFTNVLCIFAQDFGSLDQVAERLAS